MAEQKLGVDLNMNGKDINQLTAMYFGDPDTNGTWRIYFNGTQLLIERRELDQWVAKGAFHP